MIATTDVDVGYKTGLDCPSKDITQGVKQSGNFLKYFEETF